MKTLIKHYKFVIILVMAVAFTSCSGDDDSALPIIIPEPTNAELLANKWFLVKQIDNSTTPPTTVIANDCEHNTYFNFTDDGYIIAESFGLNGSTCESQSLESATYTLNSDEDVITITEGSSTSVVTITTLTTTELVFSLGSTEIYFDR